MKISRDLVINFIETVPLDIHYSGGKISVVGIHWGYCRDADETYGRKTVMKILNTLETNKEYQSLLD